MQKTLQENVLPFVQKPARYTDQEQGSVHKDLGKAGVKLLLGFPELYEIAMSNLGVQVLYYLVNAVPAYLCERVFSPAQDMENLLKEQQVPLFSLESQRPFADFDLLGISLQHELTYTNFLVMLELGNIPLTARDRGQKDPYVFVGGHGAFNPGPVTDFIDFAVVGEGEEVILEIMDFTKENKSLPRSEFLKKIAAIPGVYVPAYPKLTKKRYVKDLDSIDLPERPIVPFIKTVHERVNVEIMRGCGRGCRFCQAGYVLLPKREYSKQKILGQVDRLLKNTGYDEVALTSLSSGDHTQIEPLLLELLKRYTKDKVNIALPSLRVDSFSSELAEATKQVRQSGLTLAPEAGSQRLRDVLNKKISETEILDSIRKAVQNKTNSIKLYFMIGLPTETEADLQGIVELIEKIKPLLKEHKRTRCTVNISNFVPKPHTPFQWVEQAGLEEIQAKQRFLKTHIKGKQVQLRWHDPRLSYLEGIFSRGDRDLGKVLISAVQKGARFDSWDEHFKFAVWQEALQENNIDPSTYFRKREIQEDLPWDDIDTGVSKKALQKEYEKALTEVGTTAEQDQDADNYIS